MLAWTSLDILKESDSIATYPPEADESEQKPTAEWVRYEQPADTRDIVECRRVDKANREAWQKNRFHTNAIRALFKNLKSCGEPPVNPPSSYVFQMAQYIGTIMFEDSFMFIAAQRYLLETTGKVLNTDYDARQAVKMAKREAAVRFVEAMS